MKLAFAALMLMALACLAHAQTPPATSPPTTPEKLIFVKMSTTAGDIIIELNNEKAPISVANFLKYADKHFYDGTIFHRVIPFFVIQGGGFTPDLVEHKGEPPIKNEWTNGLKNIRGTIAMARDPAPDTATCQFYINVADNARLDRARPNTGNAGYAVFGRVIAGMDVVDAIRDGVTGARPDPDPDKDMDDLPTSPVSVTSVTRLSATDAIAKGADAKPGRNPWSMWRLDEPMNLLPGAFAPAQTGRGKRATWLIEDPGDAFKPTSPPGALHCTAANTGETFNLLTIELGQYKNLSLTVKVHAESGKEDQGGGVIWRAKDADNYYVARWNPLEDNFRVYHIKDGKRTQIASADIKADPKEWHKIRIDHAGAKIEASFDGKTLITVEDSTFADAGRIGFWTKADASTWFDDVAVVEK